MAGSTPRGINAARKLRVCQREARWADLHWREAHPRKHLLLVRRPLADPRTQKGIVLEKVGVEAKQPSSAIRKCVRVQLIKNGKKVTAFVPNDGCLNFVVDKTTRFSSPALGGRAAPRGIYIPGVRFKVVKVSGVRFLSLWREKKEKPPQ
ncbi:40S ribosomal protein S23 [Claviceps citrina]|nr:40S ribosomal protein S23 [Claviceps citrina]